VDELECAAVRLARVVQAIEPSQQFGARGMQVVVALELETVDQGERSRDISGMVAEADDWLEDWADNVGTDLASGMAETPGWNVFALEDDVVYHTYARTAPDRFMLVPYYSQLLDQVPAGRGADFPLCRRDEY